MSDRVVPPEIKKQVKELAEKYNRDVAEVKQMFLDEYDAEYLSSFDEESGERAQQAIFVVQANVSDGFDSDLITYQGIVFQVTEPQTLAKKDGTGTFQLSNMIGLFSKNPDKEDFKPMKIACFGDAMGQSSSIERGVPITISVQERETDYGLNLSTNNIIHKKIDKVINLKEFISDNIGNPLKFDEVPFKISKDESDLKVVCGRVKHTTIKYGKVPFVRYTVFDDINGPNDIMYITTNLSDEVFEKGALIWGIGINKKPSEEYSNSTPSMWADVVIGITPIKMKKEKLNSMKENAKREKEAKDGNDTSKKEKKKSEDTEFSGLKEAMDKDEPVVKSLNEW